MDLRKNVELSAAKAEEKASLLEEKLSSLSESIDREKGRLQNELVQMRSESKLSVSRISADVSTLNFVIGKNAVDGDFIILVLHHIFFSLREWNVELKVQKKSQHY